MPGASCGLAAPCPAQTPAATQPPARQPQRQRRRGRRRGGHIGGSQQQSTRSAVACLLAAITATAMLQPAAAKMCTRYRPAGCLFATLSEDDIAFPAPLHPISFDMRSEVPCLFHASGMYEQGARDQCSDAFMEVQPRPLPSCAEACCTGQPRGQFRHVDHQYTFVPLKAEKCTYFEYSRNEVLDFLQGGNMDILVAGDSMMRQLYIRLVHMMRGTRRVLDYHIHTHASYAVCNEADRFRMSPVNEQSSVEGFKQLDLDYLEDTIPSFFKYSPDADPMMLCSKPHVAVNYMHAPDYVLQRRYLDHYMANVMEPGRKLTMVLSVGYWVWFPEVPQDYLDFIEALAKKVENIVILSIPTSHVTAHTGKQGPALLHAYRSRNVIMKEWVSERPAGSNILFVDFDAMSLSGNAPPICSEENWHYQCFLTWPATSNNVALHDTSTNWFRDRHYRAPLVGLYMTEDGQCYDEMNRNLWQVIFNVIMKKP